MRGKIRFSAFSFTVVLALFCCEISMAGMSSIDVGMSVSYDFSDRKYEDSGGRTKEGEGGIDVADGDTKEEPKDEKGNTLSLIPRFRYIYSYNEKDSLELLVAPSLDYDFSDDKGVSLHYNDVRGSFFKEISERWSFSGENVFSLTDNNDDGQESNSAQRQTVVDDAVTKGSDSSAPTLDEENDNVRYYRNHAALTTRYRYSRENFMQFGVSYDLLRKDSDGVSSEENNYDRYAVQAEDKHRFNSKWGTTLQGSYVRGKYGEQKVSALPVENIRPESAESVSPDSLVEEAQAEKKSGDDVTEYRFSGSVIHYFDQENTLALEYNYIKAVYDGGERNNSVVHMGQLRWRHRFSEMLESTFGIGPAWREGGTSHFGLNGLAELRYLHKLGSYSFQITKIYDVENFDGTDQRGPVDRLNYRLALDRQLGKRLSISGVLGYSEERGDELVLAQPGEEGETSFVSEEYEKRIWRVSLGAKYHLLEEIDAGIRYSFSHLDAEAEEDSYDEHRVMMTVDWGREWLRW